MLHANKRHARPPDADSIIVPREIKRPPNMWDTRVTDRCIFPITIISDGKFCSKISTLSKIPCINVETCQRKEEEGKLERETLVSGYTVCETLSTCTFVRNSQLAEGFLMY